jgi:hypothetical protein
MPGPVRVNLADVESGGFDPVPSSRYPLAVFDGEIKYSGDTAKHPGAAYIAWQFIIQAGEYEDRYVFDNTIFAHDWLDEQGDLAGCDCGDADLIAKFNKGLFKLKNLLAATGKWTEEQLNADDFDFEIEDVVGSLVAAQVGIRKSDEFGDSNVIKKYILVDASQFASSSDLPG